MIKKLLFFTLIPFFGRAQKIVENKFDEFTKHRIARTSWETLSNKFNGTMCAKTRINKIDNDLSLELKFIKYGASPSMHKGDSIMFKLENDSIVSLALPETTLSCKGCGATGFVGSTGPGLDLTFPITPDKIPSLANHKIIKVRIYLSDGYSEESITNSDSNVIQKELGLMKAF